MNNICLYNISSNGNRIKIQEINPLYKINSIHFFF